MIYNSNMISQMISLLALIIISPFLLIISAIIVIDDGFPIFFKQKRIGINNNQFWVYKFRTMNKDTPDIPTHLVKDSYLLYTRSGPIFRKLSIDELPQLINVLKGDMVFIGPRPALYNQNDLVELRTRAGVQKLMPGITGWAQVNGRDDLSIQKKVEMDIFYKNNKSYLLDLKIIFLTVIKVFQSKGVTI